MNYGGKYTDLAIQLQQLLEAKLGSGTAISFALVQEGEVLVSACAGTKDGDSAHPADLGDVYGIGSLSKIYCTMAVMKLCEMGLADLDTPVSDYLPEFSMKDERYKDITLRMCLNHSSGLPGLMFRNFYTDIFLNQKSYYDDFFRYLSEVELKAAPGTNSVYNNDGFELAEAVVSRLSGMPFITFVQKYVTEPLGLYSACSYEKAPEGRDYIRMKDSPGECLMYVGAGGMYSDMSDCAKFGWAFVEPGKAFKAESAYETMKPQKLTYSEDEQGSDFGLGWDSVNFQVPGFDLGEGTLLKTGGSYSFSSYLAVSRAYRMSVAISATADSDSNTMGVLFEVLGVILSRFGGGLPQGDTAGEVNTSSEEPTSISLPEGYTEQYEGIYYSDSGRYRVSFKEDQLFIDRMTKDGWEEMENGLPFNGSSFGNIGSDYSFTMNGDIAYLNNRFSVKFAAIAEKPSFLPPANNAWLGRNGRRYILENASLHDMGAGGIAASAEIMSDSTSGIVSVATRGYLEPYILMPAMSVGDNETKMFLTSPTMGSKIIYPFSIYERDGKEHLSWCGYSFIDEAHVPELEKGIVSLEPGMCLQYCINEEVKFGELPEFVRIILLNKELEVTSDSRVDGPPEEADRGFAIIMSSGKGEVEIC